MILGAGAIHFQQIKTIASKTLALSALILSFFIYVFKELYSQIKSSNINFNEMLEKEFKNGLNDLLNHHQEILKKLASILNERFL